MKPRVQPGDPFCWRAIGVLGDQSCAELVPAVHCRNCHHFTAAGRALLERPAPAGYFDEWAAVLAEDKAVGQAPDLSALLFRLDTEWLALDVKSLVEVSEERMPHRIPHRGGLVSGLVNIRGQLQLCVSLHRLLGIPEPAAPQAPGAVRARLVVARDGEHGWVFRADEVAGVHRFSSGDLGEVPLTVAEAQRRFTRGLFAHESRWIGYLDSTALFAALGSLA